MTTPSILSRESDSDGFYWELVPSEGRSINVAELTPLWVGWRNLGLPAPAEAGWTAWISGEPIRNANGTTAVFPTKEAAEEGALAYAKANPEFPFPRQE